MSCSIADILPRRCRHLSRWQQLMCLLSYSAIFCVISVYFLGHKFPGYFGGRGALKFHPLEEAQHILRRVNPEGEDPNSAPLQPNNFIFQGGGNASSQDSRTQEGATQIGDITVKKGAGDPNNAVPVKSGSPTMHNEIKLLKDVRTNVSVPGGKDRTGESIAEENAALKADKDAKKRFIFRPKPLTVQYYHNLIDNEPFTNRYNTCAIVSSSGQLLGKHAGREIDSADAVIRMNAAPVKGFEVDVGSRTTVRVACFISSHQLTSQADAILHGLGAPEVVLFWGLEAPRSKRKAQSIPKVTSLQKKFMNIKFYSHRHEGEMAANRLFERETGASRQDTNSWLSTGWFTVMTALDICREVRVYGMVPEEHCVYKENEKVKYHYYQTTSSPTECTYYKVHEATPKGGHRFMTEKAIFARWAQFYNVTFHYPSWNRSSADATKRLDTPFTKLFHLKGIKYFQRGGNGRGGKEGDTAAIVVCLAIVLGVPLLFVVCGICMANFVDEDMEMPQYRYSHQRKRQPYY